MHHYECICQSCQTHQQFGFDNDTSLSISQEFYAYCKTCCSEKLFRRVLTKKVLAEQKRIEQEAQLRDSLAKLCESHGLSCRFLYQSILIKTPLAEWQFDYHASTITLYHESRFKRDPQTGDYMKFHCQFRNRKITPAEAIKYIVKHDCQHRESSPD